MQRVSDKPESVLPTAGSILVKCREGVRDGKAEPDGGTPYKENERLKILIGEMTLELKKERVAGLKRGGYLKVVERS